MHTCSKTVFHNCTFEDSGSAGVTKDDKLRGHAGGLSVGGKMFIIIHFHAVCEA